MTRAGIRSAESQGLSLSDVDSKPMLMLSWLFYAALFSDYKVSPQRAFDLLDAALDAGAVDYAELAEDLVSQYQDLFTRGGNAEA
jgi:hypothetical protein